MNDIPLRPNDEPTFSECIDGMPVDEYTSTVIWDQMYGQRCECRTGEHDSDVQCELNSTHTVDSFGRQIGLCDEHFAQWCEVFPHV